MQQNGKEHHEKGEEQKSVTGDVFPIHEKTNWRYLLPIIMMEGHTATLDNDEVSYEFTLQDPNEVFRRIFLHSFVILPLGIAIIILLIKNWLNICSLEEKLQKVNF